MLSQEVENEVLRLVRLKKSEKFIAGAMKISPAEVVAAYQRAYFRSIGKQWPKETMDNDGQCTVEELLAAGRDPAYIATLLHCRFSQVLAVKAAMEAESEAEKRQRLAAVVSEDLLPEEQDAEAIESLRMRHVTRIPYNEAPARDSQPNIRVCRVSDETHVLSRSDCY